MNGKNIPAKGNYANGWVKKHTKITRHNRRFESPSTQTPDLAWCFAGGIKAEFRCSYLSIESQICNSPGNQSAKISAAHSAKLFVQSSAKISADQSGQYFAGLKYETLSYPNPDIPNRGEITPFAKGDFSHLSKKSIKKGSTANATSLNCIFLRYLINQSGHHSVNRHWRKVQLSDCLVLRCLRLISALTAVTINCALLSPSSRFFSKSVTTSCGKRALSCCDLLLVELVAITGSPFDWCDSVYAKKNVIKGLKCDSLRGSVKSNGAIHHIATPRSATHTIEASNHNVMESYDMAMHKSTQTHPKFTWRFAECQENKAIYHTATAYTEDEARSQLPDLPLVFTARIRREVSYA